MKQTMKKCLTLLLALALLFTMAVPAAAEEPNYSRTITFTGVAKGDTVRRTSWGGMMKTTTNTYFTRDLRPLQPISMILKHNRWRSTLPKVRKSI